MTIWHNRKVGGGPGLVTVEVQKATGAWVDVGDGILHAPGGLAVEAPGRQSELSLEGTGTLTLVLNNSAGTYTPGYAGASVSLAQGMPIRVRETVGRRSQWLFSGTLDQPEAVFAGQPHGTGDVVNVTAVDWLGAQEQGRTFVSTLAEHILYTGGGDLQAYYPMLDPPDSTSLGAADSTGQPPLRFLTTANGVEIPVPGTGSLAFPGEGSSVPMDDASTLRFVPQVASGTVTGMAYADGLINPVTMTSSTITLACWFHFEDVHNDTIVTHFIQDSSGGGDLVQLSRDAGPGSWKVTAAMGASVVTFTVPSPNVGWNLATIRVTLPSGLVEYWENVKAPVTGTLSGSPPSSTTGLNEIGAGFNLQGDVAHLQAYIGTAFTRDVHLAQWRQGTNPMYGGLRWQRTDERVQTLAGYAGLSASQCELDRGFSFMPAARLAGKTFKQAADEATRTEQGRLFVAGDGRLVFHNRARAHYNV